jgi:hypothetical protein
MEGSLIQSVTSLDGIIKFDEDTFESTKYSVGNKYTSVKPSYYIKNGYLYVTILKYLKAITISGLFDDFIEAHNYPSVCGNCAECECEDIMNIEFPIDGDSIRPLLQLANEELIILFKQMGEDKSNNASDNTDSAGSMIHQPNQNQP